MENLTRTAGNSNVEYDDSHFYDSIVSTSLRPRALNSTFSLHDSAYASTPSYSSVQTIREENHGMEGVPIGTTGWFDYAKEIEKDIVEHFNQVKTVLEERLHTYIGPRMCVLIIRLMFIGKGETMTDATLRLVVFCQSKSDARKARRFFKSGRADDLCNPTDQAIPRFIPQVFPGSRVRSALLDVDVCCCSSSSMQSTTSCGQPLLLVNNTSGPHRGELRKATFGGIIEIRSKDGKAIPWGMTAGHVLQNWRNDPTVYDINSSLASEDDSDESDESDDESDKVSLDSTRSKCSSRSKNAAKIQTSVIAQVSDAWAFVESHRFGKILDNSQTGSVADTKTRRPCYDWTLFSVAEVKPNELCTTGQRQQLRVVSKPTFNDGLSDPVTLISASHGPQTGELSSSPARISMGGDAAFVDAYILKLNEGEGTTNTFVLDSL
jgi:hypothetical protein